jgi:hypothetical protein
MNDKRLDELFEIIKNEPTRAHGALINRTKGSLVKPKSHIGLFSMIIAFNNIVFLTVLYIILFVPLAPIIKIAICTVMFNIINLWIYLVFKFKSEIIGFLDNHGLIHQNK